MTKITSIEGIGEVFAQKLSSAGITTIEILLEKAASARDRKALAEKTGISEALILKWVNRADLFRIHGIGEQYSDLLEYAGVDSVPELAQRKPENLLSAVTKTNLEKKLVNKLPTLDQVTNWIEQAKQLPKLVTH